uniref:Uncharacterized protein n=1 Tax=Avena sativa TaxID=4498 RepID=A0ACD6A7S3_AVESA
MNMAALGQVRDGGAVASELDEVRGLGATAEVEVRDGRVATSAVEEVQGGRAAATEMDEVRRGDAGAVEAVRGRGGKTATCSVVVEQVRREGKKPKTVRDLALILRYLDDGGQAPDHVHEENVYSDCPANLVQVRQHAFRATGHGSQMVWLFYTRTPVATNGKNRRPRKVGGNEGGTWHEEKDEPDITGADGEPVLGYMKRFSYRLKSPSGGGRGVHTGWSMFQISLRKHGDEKVLCMLCKSNHKPKIFTATSSGAGASRAETPVLGEEDVPAAAMPAFAITPTFKRSVEEVKDTGAAATASTGKSLVDAEEAAAGSGRLAVVMALGEASIPSAQRFKVMIEHILGLAQDRPVLLLLSATGGTHTNIEQAVRRALMLRCGEEASDMHEVTAIKELYLGTVHELGLDSAIVTGPLNRLEQHLQSILVTKELTPTTQDYLASFGQRISATIFCAYLKEHGKNIHQVWRDAHGVLTRDDPSIIFTNVLSFTYFSLHDAIELACSSAQGMNPGSMSSVIDDGISVIIVKNPCNPQARGKQARDLSKHKLSSIMFKQNIVMLDIARTGDPSQRDFIAQVSSIFEDSGISVDLDASRGNIFLTLDPSNLGGCELSHQIVNLVEKVKEIAVVQLEHISIISLVGNEHESTPILAKVIDVLTSIGVHAKKVSQRSSKAVITVTLVVDNSEAKDCVRALHSAFFENGFAVSQGADQELNSFPAVQVPESSQAAAARSGDKRKADGHHPAAPPGVRQERADTTARNGRDETEPRLFSTNDIGVGGEGDPPDEALDAFFHSIDSTGIEPVRVDVGTVLAEQANDIALSGMQRLLFSEEDPVLVGGISDKDSDRDWARLLFQPEQQVLDEAAVSDDRLRTGTEVLLEEFSPEDLLGPSNGGMSCPSPPPFVPSC